MHVTNSHVPFVRWVAPQGALSASYGSVMSFDQFGFNSAIFRVTLLEARALDPQQQFVLDIGYCAILRVDKYLSCLSTLQNMLTYSDIGVFVGVEPSGIQCHK